MTGTLWRLDRPKTGLVLVGVICSSSKPDRDLRRKKNSRIPLLHASEQTTSIMSNCFVNCWTNYGRTCMPSPTLKQALPRRSIDWSEDNCILKRLYLSPAHNVRNAARRKRTWYARVSPQSPNENRTTQSVKPTYYKNPSRAIEKGGGFYIPGLRGPRLRYAVGILALFLLFLNTRQDFENLQSLPLSFKISTLLAAFTALAVIGTAVQDTKRSLRQMSVKSASSVDSLTSKRSKAEASARSEEDSAEFNLSDWEMNWVASVVGDMVCDSSGSVFIFERRGSSYQCIHRPDNGEKVNEEPSEAGPVVNRVGQEQRSLYVDDSASLPPGIDLPFLQSGIDWRVYLVPINSGKRVVAVARPKHSSNNQPISLSDRRWIDVLADRLCV